MPRLILAHNLHGIDIDLRAAQIAALALWLRCQRAYREMGLKKERPKITRSNLVCAEPMPGEEGLLEEFLATLQGDRLKQLIHRVLQQEGRRQYAEGRMRTAERDTAYCPPPSAYSSVRATPEMADRLCELVRLVWDRMKLAGEAGSLLKIEEELQEAIRKGQEEWEENQPLFRFTEYGLSGEREEKLVQFVADPEISFWNRAEALVMAALDDFAAYAANGRKLLRKLFVDDAMRGFAFVDACRHRFDVVLMNPPFGESSKTAKAHIEKGFPASKTDLFAAFVEQGLVRLTSGGYLGAITSRTGFFLASFEKWREVLINHVSPRTVADLGYDVLDTAMVETAAYCLSSCGERTGSLFFRLLESDQKGATLKECVTATRTGISNPELYLAEPRSFPRIPGSPFAYWISEGLRRLYSQFPPLGSEGRVASVGASSKNDFKYVRLWTEVSPEAIARDRQDTYRASWVPYAKGGRFSPYYSDLSLVINWYRDGELLKSEISEYRGSRGWGYQWSAALNGHAYYFLPGLTWLRRSHRFCTVALPREAIFSDGAQAIISERDHLPKIAAITNSVVFDYLIKLSVGRTGAGVQFMCGTVSSVPFPPVTRNESLEELFFRAWRLNRSLDTVIETPHAFESPAIMQTEGTTLAERATAWNEKTRRVEAECNCVQKEIDTRCLDSYFISEPDRAAIMAGGKQHTVSFGGDLDTESVSCEEVGELRDQIDDTTQPIAEMVSWLVGIALGRFDVRTCLGRADVDEEPAPFDPLPVFSPGMLQASDIVVSKTFLEAYPVRIDWDGILVDDPGNQDDIVRRVRDVLEVIWGAEGSGQKAVSRMDKNHGSANCTLPTADSIEKEACEILGVKSLRDYFRKPSKGGFWDDHVKRYSKSRRKAPIYWLLQSSRKNYALWLYYHRLDKDMLFKSLLNYVEPKIRQVSGQWAEGSGQLENAKSSGTPAKEIRRLEKEREKLDDFLSELRDFEEKLRRVANLHLDPDLNDGVVLNIAPLHELVPWKEAKKYWNELMDGKYEWSTIGKQLREKGLVT